jgi:hypothetical protein
MSVGAKGRSLELYFIDGKPDGMLTAEVFNWTGHVLMAPRTQITAALQRQEARYTGVYLLIGDKDGEPFAYIGEGEDISDRIRNHDTKRDWWSTAILVTSAANNLNKAHVKYLESRLIEEARSVGKVTLENGNTPARASLSEAAQSNMQAFLDYLLMVLPALRIDMFLRKTRPDKVTVAPPSMQAVPVFELHTKKHGLHATARLEDGEFIVQAGSLARASWASPRWANTAYGQLHAELLKMGVLKTHGTVCIFAENYAFKSPSAAAAVVNGRSANGTIEWKVLGQTTTYKEWEATQLAEQPFTVAAA